MPWIDKLKKNNRKTQFEVYQRMSPKLYAVCRRYLKHEVEIEEAMSDAFVSIFKNIHQLEDEEKFDAWAKKIAVNQCLAMIRKKKVKYNMYVEDLKSEVSDVNNADEILMEEDLLNMLDELPDGCKTVFNLYAIEGYTHKEIAKKLDISEGTSKSQLNAARSKLKVKVNECYYTKVN